MTIKKLSLNERPPTQLRRYVKGKLWCYAAIIIPMAGTAFPDEVDAIKAAWARARKHVWVDRWCLGIAIADEAGYHRISGYYSRASTFDEMMDHADDLNLQRGITCAQSAIIIASTMRGRRTRSPHERWLADH